MTCIVAIDPGVTGALAFYFIDVPDRISVLDMLAPRRAAA